MKSRMVAFIENLVEQYSNRGDIYSVYYNGEEKPYKVKDISSIMMEEENSQAAVNALSDYLSETCEINYYSLYKMLMREVCGLWVNPTMEEFNVFNQKNGLDVDENLEGIESFDEDWKQKLKKKIRLELEMDDYSIAAGSVIQEELIHFHNEHHPKEVSFEEWVKPFDLSILEDDEKYIVDDVVFMDPIPVDDDLLLERDNQDFQIPSCHLTLYLENMVVTKRGLDSRELVKDRAIDFHLYQNMDDYLRQHSYEQKETTLRKLCKDAVDPSQPFLEAVVDYQSEIYINQAELRTEKDILDFVNMTYAADGMDREAKSFDRKKITACLFNLDRLYQPKQSTVRHYFSAQSFN